jgi:hypothetical protein
LRFAVQESRFAAADESTMPRVTRLLGDRRERLLLAATLAVSAAAAGCTPKIGDKCVLSTDCSQQGTLLCDTSQPQGYCTQLNCTNGSCPNEAVCVEFQSAVPGCAYQDYASPSRTGRSFCMAHCSQNSDCRQSQGYVCADPTMAPWFAAILDNNQSQSVCIAAASMLNQEPDASEDAAVCMSYLQDANPLATVTPGDAAELTEGGPDAGDAGIDASDAGADAELDGGADSGFDATLDAPAGDGGAADAPAGG